MAVINFQLQLDRQFAAPLDVYSLFKSKEEAENFAQNSPLAYPGQLISVATSTLVQCFVIGNNKDLQELAGGSASGSGGGSAHLYVGESEQGSAAATTNGSTYLKLFEGDSLREQYLISGEQGVSVTSSESGEIIISGQPLKDSLASSYAKKDHKHDDVYLSLSGGSVEGDVAVLTLTVGKEKVTQDDGLIYTLSTLSERGGSNAYGGSSDVTVSGIMWTVEGNSTMNPWRLGGNKLEAVDRKLTSRAPIYGKVAKIKIKYGEGSATVNTATLKIYSSDPLLSTSPSPVYSRVIPCSANSEQTIEAGSEDWTDRYYQLVFNLTVTTSGNKYVTVETMGFYAEGSEGIVTKVIKADGIHGLFDVGDLDEDASKANYLLTLSSLALWNGRTSGMTSNLKYFSGGEIVGKASNATLSKDTVLLGTGTSVIQSLPEGEEGAVLTQTAKGPAWQQPSGGASSIESYTIQDTDWTG